MSPTASPARSSGQAAPRVRRRWSPDCSGTTSAGGRWGTRAVPAWRGGARRRRWGMRCSKRRIARAIAPGGRDSVDAAAAIRHLFITQDYPPMGGGMARRHVELCRRLAPDGVTVSTVAPDAGEEGAAAAFDAAEPYEIVRQSFPFRGAKPVFNQARL